MTRWITSKMRLSAKNKKLVWMDSTPQVRKNFVRWSTKQWSHNHSSSQLDNYSVREGNFLENLKCSLLWPQLLIQMKSLNGLQGIGWNKTWKNSEHYQYLKVFKSDIKPLNLMEVRIKIQFSNHLFLVSEYLLRKLPITSYYLIRAMLKATLTVPIDRLITTLLRS
jgi:hypothetical protein